ncbi:hypothetical protein GCM10010472_13090 [Pseudonocardia halophobica]|uniref:Uncharacterized protein n=1 Tax=Pseudonocardia halophobica TaxID=29401 RepID=A0A9W6L6J4_9PSEU|nr:hypothetical protein GCM10017577_31200 [Pseudonocardia halophobica]
MGERRSLPLAHPFRPLPSAGQGLASPAASADHPVLAASAPHHPSEDPGTTRADALKGLLKMNKRIAVAATGGLAVLGLVGVAGVAGAADPVLPHC